MAVVTQQSDFWPKFSDTSDFIEVECAGVGSLAVSVLEKYGIRNRNILGGELTNLDIAHMDAMQVIKMSLLEDSVDNSRAPYEAFIHYNDNSVEFKEVGAYTGSVTNIYHTVQTASYIEDCSGVMVTGGKPLMIRKPAVWSSIWGDTMEIYDSTDMMNNCNKPNFSSHVTIAYRDPHLATAFNDGIENLYEITNDNPYDEIIGYAVRKHSPSEFMTVDVTIQDAKQCRIPIKISDGQLGTLVRRPVVASDVLTEPQCWGELARAPDGVTGGIEVQIPSMFRYTTFHGDTQDNFNRISAVYVIGYDLQHCYGKPNSDVAAIKEVSDRNTTDYDIWVSLKNAEPRIINLQEGIEYIVGFEEGGDTPYIVFANNSLDYDKSAYGTNATYNIYPHCEYAQGKGPGALLGQTGNILPIGGNSGIIVQQVWVVVDLETPSVVIHDPKGHALEIAQELQYSLYPIVVVNEPQPIGFNGELIDSTQSKQDHDPTTVQDFRDTDYELAIDQMDAGGGITMNLSFLEAEGVRKLSGVLYNYMNGQDGVETVYSCGPNCDPKLGGYGPAGGIINSITHQYSDSGSYTISCNESGRLLGNFSEITGGPYVKASESPGMPGTILQDMGNHVFFKVRVDGFGERIAVNVSSSVLRVGDRVTCTIHNNPVEL